MVTNDKCAELSDARLSALIRGLADKRVETAQGFSRSELATEAAARLARLAAQDGKTTVIAVNKHRVEFPRRAAFIARVDWRLDSAPVSVERIVVDGLEIGEYRAVDLWGDVVIVARLQ